MLWMKRLIVSASVVLLGVVSVPMLAYQTAGAANVDNGLNFCNTSEGAKTDVCKESLAQDNQNPVIKVIKIAIQIVAVIMGVAAVIVIIISGVRFITSGGDPNSVKKARDGLIYAVVGILIALLAQGIVSLVLSKI